MKKLIALPLFLLVLTIPVHAYVPANINVTYSGSLINNAYFACTNVTGTFYCYGIANNGAGHVFLERYNATLGNYTTCDMGTVGAYARTYWKGLAVANTTHLIAPQNSAPGGYRYIPINMSNCVSTDTISAVNGFNTTGSALFSGGYHTGGLIYWGLNNGIRVAETNEWIEGGFWDSNVVTKLALPIQTDNTTMYGAYENLIMKYVGGAFDSAIAETSTFWGISLPAGGWDLWNDSDTTWLYVNGYNFLYRFNFTQFEELNGGSYLTAVYPIGNATIPDTAPELHAIVYTERNGSVAFYIDGLLKINQTGTTDGISFDSYYTSTTLSEGSHYWIAYFYDGLGNIWDTGTQYFIIDTAYEGSDYTGPDMITGLGDYLDSSLQTPYGGEIFALIFSGLVAGVIWYYSGSRKLEYFIAPLMFILACFSFIGLFPIWFLVLEVMVIAIFIFFKVR